MKKTSSKSEIRVDESSKFSEMIADIQVKEKSALLCGMGNFSFAAALEIKSK